MNLVNGQDWTVRDNLESVALTSRRTVPGTGGDAVDVPIQALVRQLTYKELQASNGVYVGLDRVMLIGASQVSVGIKARDTMTRLKDNSVWTVLESDLINTEAEWRAVCRNPIIVGSLYDTVDIERSAVTYDASGAALRAWPSGTPSGGTTLYANLQCRVQPRESTIADERGMRGQQITYDVYLSQDLAAFDVRECRVVFGSVVLDIERYSSSESISDLARLECRLKV